VDLIRYPKVVRCPFGKKHSGMKKECFSEMESVLLGNISFFKLSEDLMAETRVKNHQFG